MLRVKIHKLPIDCDNIYKIRISCGTISKVKKIPHYGRSVDESYNLMRSIKEVMRDALYLKYGINYRFKEKENKKSLEKSMLSAVKRMR